MERQNLIHFGEMRAEAMQSLNCHLNKFFEYDYDSKLEFGVKKHRQALDPLRRNEIILLHNVCSLFISFTKNNID